MRLRRVQLRGGNAKRRPIVGVAPPANRLIYGVRPPWDRPGTAGLPAIPREVESSAAYQDCLRVAGLPVDPALIITCRATIEDGYQALCSSSSPPAPPTALLAINDLLAIGALRAASDLGLRVPADVSLVAMTIFPLPLT